LENNYLITIFAAEAWIRISKFKRWRVNLEESSCKNFILLKLESYYAHAQVYANVTSSLERYIHFEIGNLSVN